MNWQKIEKECPRAYGKFTFWNVKRLEKILSGQMVTADLLRDMIEAAMGHNRHLYDFFNEQRLIIHMNPIRINLWQYHIIDFKNTEHYEDGLFTNRPKTETEAFKKSFEILENQLK